MSSARARLTRLLEDAWMEADGTVAADAVELVKACAEVGNGGDILDALRDAAQTEDGDDA